nr:exo-alpha-sialidase [Pirellulales bacterium]
VYMRGVRATDGSGNVTWTKVVESDVSFTTAADSGLGTHANSSPTTIALTDGSLIRRVYGWDYGAFPNMPGTSFIQRSIDGGLTWSAAPTTTDGGVTWSNTDPRMQGRQQFLLDPTTSTVQMTRSLRLSDGRILMGGAVWNAPHAQTGASAPLLIVSADEGISWQRVTFSGPAYNATKFNEWDISELDNGDLFILSRPVSNDSRWQGIMTKTGNTWQLQTFNQVPVGMLPHSGHPELLKTQEGPILQFATTGTRWTNDFGATWTVLSGGTVNSRYYPHSLQTSDGWIYVFGHLSSPGGDDNYGGANQRVDMDKFRITVTGIPQPVIGDYDGDFEVNGDDLTEWRETFGQTPAGTINADGDEDGDIDGNDFLVWQGNLQPAGVAALAPAVAGASAPISVAAVESEPSDAAFEQLAGEGVPLRHSDPSATRRSFEARRPATDESVVNQSAHNRPLQLTPPRREIISGGLAFTKAIDVVLESDAEGLRWRAKAFKSGLQLID